METSIYTRPVLPTQHLLFLRDKIRAFLADAIKSAGSIHAHALYVPWKGEAIYLLLVYKGSDGIHLSTFQGVRNSFGCGPHHLDLKTIDGNTGIGTANGDDGAGESKFGCLSQAALDMPNAAQLAS